MPLVKDCLETCYAREKDFEWTVVDHSESQMELQVYFDNSKEISFMEQDVLQVDVLDTKLFVSQQTGEELKHENVKSMYCDSTKIEAGRGSSCMPVPPQLDEGTVRAIKGATDGLDAAITSVM